MQGMIKKMYFPHLNLQLFQCLISRNKERFLSTNFPVPHAPPDDLLLIGCVILVGDLLPFCSSIALQRSRKMQRNYPHHDPAQTSQHKQKHFISMLTFWNSDSSMSRNSLKVLRRLRPKLKKLNCLNCTQAPGFKTVCIIKRTFTVGVGAGQKKKTKQKGKFDLKSEKHSFGTLNPNLCIKHFLLLVNDTDANYKLLRTLKILGLPLKLQKCLTWN